MLCAKVAIHTTEYMLDSHSSLNNIIIPIIQWLDCLNENVNGRENAGDDDIGVQNVFRGFHPFNKWACNIKNCEIAKRYTADTASTTDSISSKTTHSSATDITSTAGAPSTTNVASTTTAPSTTYSIVPTISTASQVATSIISMLDTFLKNIELMLANILNQWLARPAPL
jgi:hypothetical protein